MKVYEESDGGVKFGIASVRVKEGGEASKEDSKSSSELVTKGSYQIMFREEEHHLFRKF